MMGLFAPEPLGEDRWRGVQEIWAALLYCTAALVSIILLDSGGYHCCISLAYLEEQCVYI